MGVGAKYRVETPSTYLDPFIFQQNPATARIWTRFNSQSWAIWLLRFRAPPLRSEEVMYLKKFTGANRRVPPSVVALPLEEPVFQNCRFFEKSIS